MAYELIVVGCSWGGTRVVRHIIGGLPADLSAAVVVAQHRGPGAPMEALVGSLAGQTPLHISEVEDKDHIEPGHVYLAPPDYHLLVEQGYFSLSTDELVQYARPSVDVLFESAADSYGSGLIAVVLTGLNEDGADGVRKVKENGGLVVVQHPDSAEKTEMPLAAISTGVVDQVLPLGDIAPYLVEACRRDSGASVVHDG